MVGKNPKRIRGVSVAAYAAFSAAFLVLGVGTARAQYCPDTGTCSNRVIPAVNANPYQLWAATSNKAPGQKRGVKSVLLYDQAPGHATGKQALRRSLSRLSQRYGFRLVIQDAPGYISDSTLAGIDIVVFANGDGDVLGGLTSPSTQAIEKFTYAQGGAVLLIHAANAYIPCGMHSSIGDPACRFLARAAARNYLQHQADLTPVRVYVDSVMAGETPPYASLSGTTPTPAASVINHGIRNPETRGIFEAAIRNFPIPRVWDSIPDEWFNYISSPRVVGNMVRNVAGVDFIEGRVNVLLSLDEMSHAFENQRMGDHPASWTRKMGHGLAAYVNMGHSDVYVRRDSVVEKYNWNLMRYLARDFVGCTCEDDENFNYEATVMRLTDIDPAHQCSYHHATSCPVSLRPDASGALRGPTFDAYARNGSLHIVIPASGKHRVQVLDTKGRLVFKATVSGGGEVADLAVPDAGVYVLRVAARNGAMSVRRVVVE